MLTDYFNHLNSYLNSVEVTGEADNPIALEASRNIFQSYLSEVQETNKKLIFIGNGGSSAIASHMALDYSKAGNVRAMNLHDPVALTAFSNDRGYENVFADQISSHGNVDDVLIAISSSGKSENILRAVDQAKRNYMLIITFSGFKPDNFLRTSGNLNFYVPSVSYGFVELSHEVLLHAFLDIHTGVFK